MFSRGELVSIRRKALRKRVWFRVLDRAERALIDLTIRVVDKVKSSRLVEVLSNPIGKLKEAMKGILDRAREIGRPLAGKFSELAQAWGNEHAKLWTGDEFYAIYLSDAINKLGENRRGAVGF